MDPANEPPGVWSRLLADLLGRRFWITAYLGILAGFLLPGDHPDWTFTVPLFLGGILFFTSLRLSWGEVVAAAQDARRWRLVAALAGVQLIGLPLIAWGLTRVIAPDWAAGILLVALMPAGLSSIAFTDLLKGDRALALLLVVTTSLVCPLTIPLALQLLGPETMRVDPAALAGRAAYILLVLAIPFIAAQTVRRVAPALVARHYQGWSMASVLCSCLLGFASIVITKPAWAPVVWQGLWAPLAYATLATAVFLGIGLASARWLPAAQAVAFACGAVYLNNGLAVAFAVRFFPTEPAMVLPAVLMLVPMVGATALIGRCLRR